MYSFRQSAAYGKLSIARVRVKLERQCGKAGRQQEPAAPVASAHWATAGESRGQDQRHVVPLNRTTQA